jgi:hypothetical protein
MSERFLRPEMEVLRAEDLVPAQNRVQPPPNRFTHRVVADTPFYFDTEEGSKEPNGYFKAGAGVVLLVEEDHGRCRVVDGQGIYAEVRASSLVERPAD